MIEPNKFLCLVLNYLGKLVLNYFTGLSFISEYCELDTRTTIQNTNNVQSDNVNTINCSIIYSVKHKSIHFSTLSVNKTNQKKKTEFRNSGLNRIRISTQKNSYQSFVFGVIKKKTSFNLISQNQSFKIMYHQRCFVKKTGFNHSAHLFVGLIKFCLFANPFQQHFTLALVLLNQNLQLDLC